MQYLKLYLFIFLAAGIFILACEDKVSQENIIAAVNGRKISLNFRVYDPQNIPNSTFKNFREFPNLSQRRNTIGMF